MSEIKDSFMRELDKEESGIDGKCAKMNAIVQVMDKDILIKLESESIEPKFYALRWIMLLFC